MIHKKAVTRSAILAAFAGLFCLYLTPLVGAVDEAMQRESILLSPTSKHYSVKAGTQTSDSFQVVNDGKTAYNFTVYARPYSVNDVSYAPDFVSEAQNADVYRWVQFDKASYYIKPGQTLSVPYTIRVPKDAASGGHYGVLFAETQPSGSTEGTAIIRKKRVGAILYTTVQGKLITRGEVKGAEVPLFQFKAPLKIRNTVSNKGNTDFETTSSVAVYDVFGGTKYTHQKKLQVLPGTSREITNDWQYPTWIGVYKVESTVKFLDTSRQFTNFVIIVPIWVYVTLAILIGARVAYAVVAHRKKQK